jgi:glycosyltransferase involved in cell wall biosynthesis
VRVLQANKFFFPGAGAETVFFATRELLSRHGHEVIDFAMRDERNLPSPHAEFFAPRRRYETGGGVGVRRARDAAAAVYSLSARRALRRLLATTRPEVAHLHNVYHQLTLSVVDELWRAGVPTVMTLHDYKPVCPAYLLYTNGAPCRRCVQGSPVNCTLHECIKGSRAASAVGSAEAAMARTRRTYDRISAFVAPSKFMAETMRAGGVGAGRLHVIPNFMDPDELPRTAEGQQGYFVFAGRVEELKGIDVLLEAVRRRSPDAAPVRVFGAGPLEGAVRAAGREGVPIEYAGTRTREELLRVLDRAIALVLPSVCEENCPMSVLEARARGIPIVCSDLGGLPELVEDGRDGLLFQGGDAGALARCLDEAEAAGDRAADWGAHGHERLLRENSPERHYDALMEVYAEAIERRRAAAAAGAARH